MEVLVDGKAELALSGCRRIQEVGPKDQNRYGCFLKFRDPNIDPTEWGSSSWDLPTKRTPNLHQQPESLEGLTNSWRIRYLDPVGLVPRRSWNRSRWHLALAPGPGEHSWRCLQPFWPAPWRRPWSVAGEEEPLKSYLP